MVGPILHRGYNRHHFMQPGIPLHHGNLRDPPRNKALLRDYEPPSSPMKALFWPLFPGRVALGGGALRFP